MAIILDTVEFDYIDSDYSSTMVRGEDEEDA